jgi:hypothetical protein
MLEFLKRENARFKSRESELIAKGLLTRTVGHESRVGATRTRSSGHTVTRVRTQRHGATHEGSLPLLRPAGRARRPRRQPPDSQGGRRAGRGAGCGAQLAPSPAALATRRGGAGHAQPSVRGVCGVEKVVVARAGRGCYGCRRGGPAYAEHRPLQGRTAGQARRWRAPTRRAAQPCAGLNVFVCVCVCVWHGAVSGWRTSRARRRSLRWWRPAGPSWRRGVPRPRPWRARRVTGSATCGASRVEEL